MIGTGVPPGVLRHRHLRARRPGPPAWRCGAHWSGAPMWWRPKATRCSTQCRRLLHVPEDAVAARSQRPRPRRVPPSRTARRTATVPVLVFVGALTSGKRPDRFVEVVAAVAPPRGRGCAPWCAATGPWPRPGGRRAGARPSSCSGRARTWQRCSGEPTCFVFPSLPTGEGMPGVLIEAGMTGLPVVATAVPGVRTIVEDGATGFVVGVDDLDAMVQATARLLAQPDPSPGHGCRGPPALWRTLQPRRRGRVLDRVPRPARGAQRHPPARAKCARYPAATEGADPHGDEPGGRGQAGEVLGPVAVHVHAAGPVAHLAEPKSEPGRRERGDDVRAAPPSGAAGRPGRPRSRTRPGPAPRRRRRARRWSPIPAPPPPPTPGGPASRRASATMAGAGSIPVTCTPAPRGARTAGRSRIPRRGPAVRPSVVTMSTAPTQPVEERSAPEQPRHRLAAVEGGEARGPLVEVGVELSGRHGRRSRFRIAR